MTRDIPNRPGLATLLILLLLAGSSGCDDTSSSSADLSAQDDVSSADQTSDLEAPRDADAPDERLEVSAVDASELPDSPVDLEEPEELYEVYLLDAGSWPESVTFDAEQRAFFTASLDLGNVHRIDASGRQTVFFEGNPEPGWLGLGVEADSSRRRLWVCAVFGTAMERAELWMLDLDTGERLTTYALDETVAGGVCNDMALADEGVIYITDREAGRVYRLDPGADRAEIFAEDPLLSPEIIGQNGIVLSDDEAYLITTKYASPVLMRISTSDPADVVEVDLGGFELMSLGGGADGAQMFEGKLYITQDFQVVEVTPTDATWASATVSRVIPMLRDNGSNYPGFSGLTEAEGDLYASRSDVVLFALGFDPLDPFLLQRVDIASGVSP